MSLTEARRLLDDTGAMLSGHFLLSSGRHSDVYVEKGRVLERPDAVAALASRIASWYPDIDVVVSPAVGAIVLGFAVALDAGARFVFAERESGRLSLRRGFRIEPGERALVVEDVVTTGDSAREVCSLVTEAGAVGLGVAALVDRSQADPGFPLRSVLRIEAVSWDGAECPQCRAGVPIVPPGSRYLDIAAKRSPSPRG